VIFIALTKRASEFLSEIPYLEFLGWKFQILICILTKQFNFTEIHFDSSQSDTDFDFYERTLEM